MSSFILFILFLCLLCIYNDIVLAHECIHDQMLAKHPHVLNRSLSRIEMIENPILSSQSSSHLSKKVSIFLKGMEKRFDFFFFFLSFSLQDVEQTTSGVFAPIRIQFDFSSLTNHPLSVRIILLLFLLSREKKVFFRMFLLRGSYLKWFNFKFCSNLISVITLEKKLKWHFVEYHVCCFVIDFFLLKCCQLFRNIEI
jgi:hypothetical protein